MPPCGGTLKKTGESLDVAYDEKELLKRDPGMELYAVCGNCAGSRKGGEVMKILVAYYSETGNTRRVAEAIFQAIEGEDKELKPLNETGNIDEYTLIFCGFPVRAHSAPIPVQDFLKRIPPGKNVALFSTHGSSPEGQMPQEAIKNAVGLVKGEILGSFTCRGKVPQGMIENLAGSPQHRAWADEASSASSHPDEADLEDARFFAQGVMKKVSPMKGFFEP